jgi:seryl-tRNA synthetase
VNTSNKKSKPSIPKAKLQTKHPEGRRLEKNTAETSETASVDKIRDILFGNQMRDYERKFGFLEERLLKEIADLRDETGKRIDSIETYIKKEVESLSDRLKAEQDIRSESDQKTLKELHETAKTLSENVEKLDAKQSKDARDLRQQLLEQSKNLSNEIRKKHQESSTTLHQSVQELQAAKVDRFALSELLIEMAARMSNELSEKLKAGMGDSHNE